MTIVARKAKRRFGGTVLELLGTLVLLACYLVYVALYLVFLPLWLLIRCFGRNVRVSRNGVEVYTVAFGVESRHAWEEIEAFWSFNYNAGRVWDRQWCLVLKDRRTIFLPSTSLGRLSRICDAHDRETNGGRGLAKRRTAKGLARFDPKLYCFDTCSLESGPDDEPDTAG
jgi:hypothetical protein